MHLVLLIFRYFPHGGLQRDMRLIAEEAVRRGWRVTVLTQRWQGEVTNNVKVVTFPPVQVIGKLSSSSRNRRFFRQAAHWLMENPSDSVLSMNKMPLISEPTKINGYFQGDECFAELVARDKPFWYRFTPRCRHFLHSEKVLFQSGCDIFMLSKPAISHFVKHYGEQVRKNMLLLKPGLPRDSVWTHPMKHELNAKNIKLLFVASNFWLKGLDRVIHAMATLPNKSHITLTVIGSDKVTSFQDLASKLNVNVTFLGSRDDVTSHMRQADLLIHPARMENAGMVLLEALANALPVLTTANCGYAPLIADHHAGIVIPDPFLQIELNATLAQMTADLAALSLFGHNAHQFGKTLAETTLAEQIIDKICQ